MSTRMGTVSPEAESREKSKARLNQTEYPNAKPAAERCPG